MAVIQPFRALRYYEPVAGPLKEVTAPPYDVISPAMQERLYGRHPYNIVRLILPQEQPGDTESANKYTRAAETLARWREEQVLRRDAEPALYVYDQHFAVDGRPYVRHGFIARVLLEPFGSGRIFPHEQTMSGPKEDRARLTRACRANLSQVFALHPDADGAVGGLLAAACARIPPAADYTDDDGVRQVLWALTDPATVAKVAALMAPKPLYIADGHHRYETALNLRDELRRGGPIGSDPADYVSIDCVAIEQPGLVILPTHRLLKVGALDAAGLLEKLRGAFEVLPAGAAAAAAFRSELEGRKGQGVLGCYVGGRYYLLRVKAWDAVDRLCAGHCGSWRRLDVAALHILVFQELFGIPFEKGKSPLIEFIQGIGPAAAEVDSGRASAAFLLRPTSVGEVKAVAEASDRMPPKSTYFYPKLISGMVINPIE